ncbi:flagellar hook protein FlgE [Alkalimarinus coralli]|uniref:flagellar hook protein FlgE n=1 Tax=Alkalimarinus coralli TaxID=2935863 RepID=UPI00202B32D5|nr:flagellar hook protein FlgE [Alkalimarinus coralli]
MPFNVALSGLKASSLDLEVTGNNIANTSTVGFKKSRAEFGDLYSNAFLGGGSNSVGDGVQVQNVRQVYNQGNISFTDRGLDLAISGSGFYVLSDGGETKYSRAGQFGVDKDGFVVNNTGMRLQGFDADDDGNVGGVLTDIEVDNSNLAPVRTTLIDPDLNLDSSQSVLEERGTRLLAQGGLSGEITAGISNGFPSETWTINLPDGTTNSITTAANTSAGAIAASLSTLPGVDASASTLATLDVGTYNPAAGDSLLINGVTFSGTDLTSLSSLAIAVNGSALGGVTAVLQDAGLATERLELVHNQGGDLSFTLQGTGTINVDGVTTNVLLDPANAAPVPSATVGGILDIIVEEGATLTPATNTLVASFSSSSFRNNQFDPTDAGTYNHATSTTIYDSLGNAHVATMYFVKQGAGSTVQPNTWQMHMLIDGQDVGDPVVGTTPTRASYTLIFNEDGTMNQNLSDQVLVSNWTPLDPSGNPNGASGPINVANGGALPIPNPPTSSNFEIDLSDTTQFGSSFSVSDMQQNGFTTGRLVGLDVDESGILFARYTNGESRVLSQVALANFNNEEGLSPAGETAWVQTFASGDPVVGAPGTGTLGSLTSSSVEESNVDLSDELVNLIVAQRNYQANAKTIETADQVTQTILNI